MTSIILLFILAASGQALANDADLLGAPEQTLDYQLGPGDVLSIHVSGLREFAQTTRVSNSGRIHVPYVGIMLIAGLTAVQVERDIARLIKEHELVKEPSVRVEVDQHRAQPAYVIGEFNAPGQYMITGEMYLLDLLGKAGGLLPTADENGFLYRRNSRQPTIEVAMITEGARPVPDPGTPRVLGAPTDVSLAGGQDSTAEEVVRVNLSELREGTRPEMNVRLQGGDIFYVPRMRGENIYVIGDVKMPGIYTLPRRGEVTAAQAVIYAGGPLPTAKMGSAFLVRHDEAGVREVMPVNFQAIVDGRSPDIRVLAGDIIFVPSSAVRTVGHGLWLMLPNLIRQLLIF